MTAPETHVGRFAPSPTGPLHFGSLVAALGSYVAARAANGRWLVRIDDIDPPREQAGAADTILRQLEAHGMHWDGPVIRQSERGDHYAAALERLEASGRLYRCTCTRREIVRIAANGPLGSVYPGTCRHGDRNPARDAALRLRLDESSLILEDRIQGACTLEPERSIGDIVLHRRDGLYAYHLANAVDDAELSITDIVRGADLLPASLVELVLLRLLGRPAPRWCHLPVATQPGGQKLSKQTGAHPLDPADPMPALLAAWRFLGQAVPPERPQRLADFHAHAIATWSPRRVPAGPLPAPTG